MPVRRSPYLGASNQPGGGGSPIERATTMPMRPSMPMSPAGSAAPTGAGAGMGAGPGAAGAGAGTGMGAAGATGAAGPLMGEPRLPIAPPPQPMAGGPTSPMNISSMLSPRMTPPGVGAAGAPGLSGASGATPTPTPLPAFGDSQGSSTYRQTAPGMTAGAEGAMGMAGPRRLGTPQMPMMPPTGQGAAGGNVDLSSEAPGSDISGRNPLLHLRLMKALGNLG